MIYLESWDNCKFTNNLDKNMNEIMYNTISNKKNIFVANSIQSIRTRNNIKTCVYNIAYKNR